MITREQQSAIFDALPEWIKEAYYQDSMVQESIYRLLHFGMSADNITKEVGHQCYKAYRKLMQEAIDRAMNAPAPAYIVVHPDQIKTP